MYKYRIKQISLTDFNTPVGMKLNPDNCWVKKATLIPRDEIGQRYAKLFTNHKGNVAKPLRPALGACIIQAEYGYSDEEVAFQIQENVYLQFFCGYIERYKLNVLNDITLLEIAFLLDTNMNSLYVQKNSALKKLRKELAIIFTIAY